MHAHDFLKQFTEGDSKSTRKGELPTIFLQPYPTRALSVMLN